MNKFNPVCLLTGYTAGGKTSMAAGLAQSLGFSYVDIGSVVRTMALDAIDRGCDISNSSDLEDYLGRSELKCLNDLDKLQVGVNDIVVNPDDPSLRQPFLDTETLLLAQLANPRLHEFQREIATVSPTVFSVRNIYAFTPEEAIRIYVDPGMTTRLRRRALFEYDKPYGDLARENRRNLIQRVVIKEKENIANKTAMSLQEMHANGIIIFRNTEDKATNIRKLTGIAEDALYRQFPEFHLQTEGYGSAMSRR